MTRVLSESTLTLAQGSQMRRHLRNDADEWIKEILNVPIYCLTETTAKGTLFGEKMRVTLLSLTPVGLCEMT